MELIQNDGSPSGSKLFVLWNPPLRLKMVCSVVKSYSSRVFNGKLFSTFRSSEVLLSCRSQRELRVALMMTLLTNIWLLEDQGLKLVLLSVSWELDIDRTSCFLNTYYKEPVFPPLQTGPSSLHQEGRKEVLFHF